MDTWELLAAERRRLATELESLSPQQWAIASQCDGWTVRDVVAHVAMTPTLTMGRALPVLLRHRFNVTHALFVIARDDRRTPLELIAALRDVAEARGTPPGAKAENVLADIVLHARDVERPLGRPCGSSEAALRVAADMLAGSDFNCQSAKRAKGLRLVATDLAWTHGEGPEVHGPLHALIEAIGGRGAAIADLAGDGVQTLAARCTHPSSTPAGVA